MSPSIISSGFKRSGIYPFNPDAIDYGMAVDTDADVEVSRDKEGEPELCSSDQCVNVEETPVRTSEQQFTPEQEELFNRRYEENYDIPDLIYLEWLKINHPESHPDSSSLSDHFSFVTVSDDLLFQELDDIYPLAEDNSLCLVNSDANLVCQAVNPLPEEVIPVCEDEPTKTNSQAAPDTVSCLSRSSAVNEHASKYIEKVNSKEVSTTNDAWPGPPMYCPLP